MLSSGRVMVIYSQQSSEQSFSRLASAASAVENNHRITLFGSYSGQFIVESENLWQSFPKRGGGQRSSGTARTQRSEPPFRPPTSVFFYTAAKSG